MGVPYKGQQTRGFCAAKIGIFGSNCAANGMQTMGSTVGSGGCLDVFGALVNINEILLFAMAYVFSVSGGY